MSEHLNIYADLRWPSHTGIGQVQKAYLARKPEDITVIDLRVPGRIGHPLSPLRITISLAKAHVATPMFCSFGFIPPLIGSETALVFVHDLIHLKHYGVARRIYYNLLLKPLYKKCAAIICVSQFTRMEFLSWSGMAPEKVHVIPNGVAPAFYENSHSTKLPYEYVLYPGNHRAYKNTSRLLDAFRAADLHLQGIHLVLTGSPSPELEKKIKELSLSKFVHFFGQVPDEEMPKLYHGARAVVLVSLYEGFGLPILEAMASEVPVVTSCASAMPEVAGEAAILVNPLEIQEIAEALKQAVTNDTLRQTLIAKGKKRAESFSWDESARMFWELVRQCEPTRPAHRR